MTYEIFEDSSFTLKSRANAWVIPPDHAVMVMHEISPSGIKLAIMGIFLKVEDDDVDNMDNKDCADALIINAIITASKMTDTQVGELTRYLSMPYKYRMAFQELEKRVNNTPTSEDLKEMFGM